MAMVYSPEGHWQQPDHWAELLTAAGYIGNWDYTEHGEDADEVLHNLNTGTTIVLSMENADQEHLPQWKLEITGNGQCMSADLHGRYDSKIIELLRVWLLL